MKEQLSQHDCSYLNIAELLAKQGDEDQEQQGGKPGLLSKPIWSAEKFCWFFKVPSFQLPPFLQMASLVNAFPHPQPTLPFLICIFLLVFSCHALLPFLVPLCVFNWVVGTLLLRRTGSWLRKSDGFIGFCKFFSFFVKEFKIIPKICKNFVLFGTICHIYTLHLCHMKCFRDGA